MISVEIAGLKQLQIIVLIRTQYLGNTIQHWKCDFHHFSISSLTEHIKHDFLHSCTGIELRFRLKTQPVSAIGHLSNLLMSFNVLKWLN